MGLTCDIFRLPWDIMPYVGPVLLTIGFGGLVVLIVRMSRRGASLVTPEVLFLITSMLLFAPYALIKSRTGATHAGEYPIVFVLQLVRGLTRQSRRSP